MGFVLGIRQNGLRELIRAQREEHETTRSLILRYHEEVRKEREEIFRKGDARSEEMREFMREILLRNEKVYTAVIAEAEEGRKQIAANTQAVLSVLDRLNGSGPPV
jgi:hypothetical protein